MPTDRKKIKAPDVPNCVIFEEGPGLGMELLVVLGTLAAIVLILLCG